MRLTGTRVLVTGASGGLGTAVARELAGHGARPVLTGRDPAVLARLGEQLAAETLAADLGDPASVADLAAAAGPVDGVIHCAGTGRFGPFADTDPPAAEELLRINLAAPIALTRALLPAMIARRRGHVAFVASVAGLAGVPNEAVYSAAKAGVITFADALRSELRGSGVGVSWIAPAAIETGYWARRGSPYERRVPRMRSAGEIAQRCVADIESGRAERIVPGWVRVAAALRATAPGLYRSLADRFG